MVPVAHRLLHWANFTQKACRCSWRGKMQMKAAVEGRTTGTVPGIQSGLVKSMQPFSSEHQNLQGAESIFSKGLSRLSFSLWIHSNTTIKAKIRPPYTKSPPFGLWGMEISQSLGSTHQCCWMQSTFLALHLQWSPLTKSQCLVELAGQITLFDTHLCWRDAV